MGDGAVLIAGGVGIVAGSPPIAGNPVLITEDSAGRRTVIGESVGVRTTLIETTGI